MCINLERGHHGRDHMQSVHIVSKVVSSNPDHGEVYTQYIMWKSLLVTCGRSVVFSESSTNKTDHHNITEILLKVALNTIALTLFI